MTFNHYRNIRNIEGCTKCKTLACNLARLTRPVSHRISRRIWLHNLLLFFHSPVHHNHQYRNQPNYNFRESKHYNFSKFIFPIRKTPSIPVCIGVKAERQHCYGNSKTVGYTYNMHPWFNFLLQPVLCFAVFHSKHVKYCETYIIAIATNHKRNKESLSLTCIIISIWIQIA